jgi:hypothetical protein
MKAIELQTILQSPGAIEIPVYYQDQFKSDQEVKVIVLMGDTEDESWKKLTTKQFFSGYSDEDIRNSGNDLTQKTTDKRIYFICLFPLHEMTAVRYHLQGSYWYLFYGIKGKLVSGDMMYQLVRYQRILFPKDH